MEQVFRGVAYAGQSRWAGITSLWKRLEISDGGITLRHAYGPLHFSPGELQSVERIERWGYTAFQFHHANPAKPPCIMFLTWSGDAVEAALAAVVFPSSQKQSRGSAQRLNVAVP